MPLVATITFDMVSRIHRAYRKGDKLYDRPSHYRKQPGILIRIVTNSVGLRWAAGGPFISFHIGGGPTGFAGYFKQFARGLQLLWRQFQVTPVILSGSVKQKLLDQIRDHYGRTPIPELEAQRDASQIAVIHALKASQPKPKSWS